MRIEFRSRPPMMAYLGACGRFQDGEVRDVDDGEARRLLTDFPSNFSPAGAASENEAPEVTVEEKQIDSAVYKQITGDDPKKKEKKPGRKGGRRRGGRK